MRCAGIVAFQIKYVAHFDFVPATTDLKAQTGIESDDAILHSLATRKIHAPRDSQGRQEIRS